MHMMTSNASTTSTARSIKLDLQPDPRDWKQSLSDFTPDPARSEMGIPNDRPIVFSGHQPIVFHNGILAKLIAQHEIAQQSDSGRVWIVADQDVVELESVRIPVGNGMELRSREIHILEPGSLPLGVASASLPSMEPIEVEDDRLGMLVEYLRGYTYEPTLAKQFASATIQLACDRLGIEPPQIVYASELLQSDTIWGLVQQRLIADPSQSVLAYNDATARYPEARVRPLAVHGEIFELPLWGLRGGQTRIPINSENVGQFSSEQLAPRGLLMSGLVRSHLGELFIHGTGGWRYDQITQDWVRDWLGKELKPMALATATMHLPLGISAEDAVDLKAAHWRFHHARHHPGMVGDESAQAERDEIVRRIEEARAAGQDPDSLYQQLVRVLEAHRDRNAGALGDLKAQIQLARSHAKQIGLANDRTWAFPLFSDESLHELHATIRAAMA